MKQLTFAVNIRVPDHMDEMDALDTLADHLGNRFDWAMIQRDARTVIRQSEAERDMYRREVW